MFKVLKWTSFLACLSFAFGAAAADGDMMDSEYLHQTAAGVWEVTPGFGQAPGNTASNFILNNGIPGGYTMTTFNFKNAGGEKFAMNSLPINVQLEYGINSMWSVGLELAYGTGQATVSGCPSFARCNSTYIKGLYDPQLFVKGRSAVGPGVLQYGAMAQVSVEKNTLSSTGDGNNASGGMNLTPFVAYQMMAGPGTWGARFQYTIYQGDKKGTDDEDSPSSTATKSGGGDWVIDTFYEVPVAGMTIGGAVFYQQSPETRTAGNGGAKTGDFNAYNILGLEVYAPVKVSMITILPNITYESINYSQSDTVISSANIIQVGAAARMSF